ncbi:MAG: hypothetical protein DRJ69_06930 [Thermoprotei archaeon]|nr:MAG: hypothetical protein DRJ69_06930 [Thermoprotei archaeon]
MKSFFKTASICLLVALTLVPLYLLLGTAAAQEELPPRKKTLITRLGAKVTAYKLFNPFLPGYRGETGHGNVVQEYLFYQNLLNGSVIPWLATRWEYGPEYKNMTIYIRKGVKWSDGKPFTAHDVAFTYNMLRKYGAKLAYGAWANATIKNAVALDDYTVYIEFTYPNPRHHYQLLYNIWAIPIVPKHIWEKVDPTTFKNYPPVVTGPYELVSASPETFIWKRRDDYWAKEVLGVFPEPEYLVFTGIGPAEKAMIEQIKGRMDVWCDFTKSQYEEIMSKNPKVKAWTILAPCPRALWINNDPSHYPLNMSEVRWAINYAINKTKLSLVAYEGLSWPADLPLPEYGALDYWRNALKKAGVLSKYNITVYDPDKAISILKNLGFKRGPDGVWVTPDGKRLSFVIIAPPWTGHKEMAMSIADDLNAIGIETFYKVVEPAPFDNAWSTGSYDMLIGWCCGVGLSSAWDPYGWLIKFHSKWLTPIGERAPDNWARYKNPEFDAILDQLAAKEPKDPDALPLYVEAFRIWLRDLPIIPTVHSVLTVTYDYTYWENYPSEENPYMMPLHWWPNYLFTVLHVKRVSRPEAPPPIPWGTYIAVAIAVIVIVTAAVIVYRRRVKLA